MKKTLLFISVALFAHTIRAQQGYQWTFGSGTSPFASVAATPGAAGSYTLTDMGDPVTTGVTSGDITFFTGCTGANLVGAFSSAGNPAGLTFTNSPSFVGNTYTIEMVVKLTDRDNAGRRLIGFGDITSGYFPGTADDGIYVSPTTNLVGFYTSPDPGATEIGSSPVVLGDWYHFVFVRDAVTQQITCYQNNVLIGTYSDVADNFVPKLANNFNIFFLKDDDGMDPSGEIAKIAIFDAALTAGQVAVRYNNVCNTNLITLPVSFANFVAKKAGAKAQLNWATASEDNNKGFEVLRKGENGEFSSIGFVAGNGTATTTKNYQYTDAAPLKGKNYYRLKQINIDGRTTLSTIRYLDMGKDKQDIQLFPNPSNGLITITQIEAGNQLSIFNSNGVLISKRIATNAQEQISIDKLSTGVYLLHVTDSDNNIRAVRFTKL